MNKNNALIESLGASIMETVYKNREPAEFPELPGADCIHDYHIKTDDGGNGYSRLWETLKGAVNKRGSKSADAGQRVNPESRDQRDTRRQG